MDVIRKKIRKILLEKYLQEEMGDEKTFPMQIFVDEKDKNDIWNIKQVLNSNGLKVYIVGGAVRDAVKNAIKIQKNPQDTTIDIPKDFDLATDASPDEIKVLFKNAPFISNILHIGESFAIQFLVTKSGNRYELATFRSDVGGGRKPDSVKFEKYPEEDAKRRDLTINALFYDVNSLTETGFDGAVIDYVGGVNDIKNNVVNTVGDAQDRFSEDPLRKIRAIRFAAKMGSKIPDNVASAIRDGETSLVDRTGKMVSSERIRDEFFKGVTSAKSTRYFLDLLLEFDFFKYIFGDLNINSGSFVEEHHPIVLAANLLKGNDVKAIGKELNFRKYSADVSDCIVFLVSLLKLNEDTVSAIKKFYLQRIKSAKPIINEKPYPMTEDVMDKFARLNNIDGTKIHNMLRLANEFKQPSEMLMSIGYKQDAGMGIAIARLEKEFYKNPDRIKGIIESGDADAIKKIIFISK